MSRRRTGSASSGSIARKQLGLAAGGELAEQVGRIVGIHLVEHPSQSLGVEPLDEPDLVLLVQLLQQVGEPVVFELTRKYAAATQRQLADRVGHLGRMQIPQLSRLTVDRPLGGEQLAGL